MQRLFAVVARSGGIWYDRNRRDVRELSFFRRRWREIAAGVLILGFTGFAVLALRRYGMLAHWYWALLPAAVLAPLSIFVLRAPRRAHRVFFAAFLICGLLYLAAVPILQVSDEPQHFLRSYEIAVLRAPQALPDGSVGDFLPGGLIPAGLSDYAAMGYDDIRAAWDARIDRARPVPYDFPGSALYSPLSYLPHAAGIAAANLLTDRAVVILYAGRAANLLAAAVLCALAVKLFPFSKALPALLLLTPIYVHKAGSMSADGLTLAVVALWLAYVLHLQYTAQGRLRTRQLVPLYLLVLMLSQCKIVYLPVCLFFFVLSPERFGSRKRYFWNLAGLIVLAVGAGLGWLVVSSRYLAAGYSTSGTQIAAILHDPLGYCRILLRTLRVQGRTLLEQMMGIGMGVGGVRNSRLLTYGYLVLIVLTAIFSRREGGSTLLQRRDVWLALVSALGVMLLTCTALYIQWTTPGNDTIMGLQGRYFLPVLYLVSIAALQVRPHGRLRREISWELPVLTAAGVNLVAAVSCVGYGLTL